MLDKLTRETFEPLIGEIFKLTLPDSGGEMDLKLADVEELPTGRRQRRYAAQTQRRAPFSIFFLGPQLLPQAMYPLSHSVLGSEPVSIFIVPVGEFEGQYEYEAIFT